MAAVGLVMASLGYWLACGANRGWTKTSVPVKTLDDVTGIEGISYRKQFVPGVDFLGAAAILSGILGSASFVFRRKGAALVQPDPQNRLP
jgi:hypothetical protein